jgi:hypothetical protein
VFYCEDTSTGQQTSLCTKDRIEARTPLHSKNEAFRQPLLNLQIARAYWAVADPQIGHRSWQQVMDEMAQTKTGPTRRRHDQAMKEAPFDAILRSLRLSVRDDHTLSEGARAEAGRECAH